MVEQLQKLKNVSAGSFGFAKTLRLCGTQGPEAETLLRNSFFKW